MDRIIISKESANNLTVTKDSYVIINDEVQTNLFEINIIDCNVTIIDMSSCENKFYNFKNSQATLIEIINNKDRRTLNIDNDGSNIEYNIVDLCDYDVDYKIKEQCFKEGQCNINIACVCYKNKNKKYVVDTGNMTSNTLNEVNCFGIVKDKSVLNYEVTSLIVNGAKGSVVKQNSNILLFDEKSLGKNNPVLLIEENDVKASHGSSIGKIDDETMFYLCSRGLSKKEATNLICLGKVGHLIKKIKDEEIKERLVNNFKERMG